MFRQRARALHDPLALALALTLALARALHEPQGRYQGVRTLHEPEGGYNVRTLHQPFERAHVHGHVGGNDEVGRGGLEAAVQEGDGVHLVGVITT